MKTSSRLVTTVIAIACIAVGLLCAQDAKVDVTGEWVLMVMSVGGTGTPTVTFKQDGENLTGHYSSELIGEADLKGTVKGQAIEFIVSADVQGTKFDLKYTGTVEGKEMKGKVSSGDFGDGTFTGKRKGQP